MPFIQWELDAKKKVPPMARALGVPDMQVGWGVTELWAWCWSERRDVVSPLMLRGFFGPVEGVGEVLAEFGFLEPVKDGWRVKGAARYLRICKAQSEAGKAHSGNLKKGKKSPGRAGGEPEVEPETTSGSVPALTPNTEHRTPRIKTTSPENGDGWQELVEKLFAVFKALRSCEPEPHGKDWRALKRLRKRSRGGDPEILSRWERGLSAKFKERVDCFSDLEAKWDSLAGGAKARTDELFEEVAHAG